MREYALATGVADPVYRAGPQDVPPEDIVVPPTFAACFTLSLDCLLDDAELGAHWNLLHGRQEYAYHRPVRVGDVLECTPWIVDISQRRRMELLTLQVDCRDLDGTPVLESRAILIFQEESA